MMKTKLKKKITPFPSFTSPKIQKKKLPILSHKNTEFDFYFLKNDF